MLLKIDNFICVKFFNILLLGFGFMFIFTAFQTMVNIEKTLVASVQKEDATFTGNAYECLALIYIVSAITNWLVPSIIILTGAKGAMLIGAAIYSIFVFSFLTPMNSLFYVCSVLTGIAASLIWTGQGVYLAVCSDKNTISRNVGLFWAMWQMSLIIGNILVFFQFHGSVDYIEPSARNLVLYILGACGIIGFILISCLRSITQLKDADNLLTDNNIGIFNKTMIAFKSALKLFLTLDMLMLSMSFLFAGMQYTFYTGVYATSVGFTLNISKSPKEVVGLAGFSIGLGELFASGVLGWLGNKFPNMGHSFGVITGFISQIIAYILIGLNLPNSSPFADTYDVSYFDPPQFWLVLICGFFLGIGDANVHMKLFSLLGTVYAEKSVGAFALYNFITGIGAAAFFYWSSHFVLQLQLGILIVVGIISTFCFCYVDLKHRKSTNNI